MPQSTEHCYGRYSGPGTAAAKLAVGKPSSAMPASRPAVVTETQRSFVLAAGASPQEEDQLKGPIAPQSLWLFRPRMGYVRSIAPTHCSLV